MRILSVVILLFLCAAVAVGAAVYAQNASANCRQDAPVNAAIEGVWTENCNSEERQGSYARFYNLTLTENSSVTVALNSSDADTYLYIRDGGETTNPFLYENDDHEDSQSQSQIAAALSVGSYTIEATTYQSGETGSFSLTIATTTIATTNLSDSRVLEVTPELTPETTPEPTTDGFVAVSTGSDHVCGIRGDGKAECWTLDETNLNDAPATDSAFIALDSFGSHTCGLGVGDDAEITCWTAPETVAVIPAPPATPIPSGEVGSRDNPVPFGATVEVHNSDTDHWEITVIGVDPYADPEIQRYSSYNDSAEEGNQFFLIRVKVKYLGTGSQRFRDYRLKALGASGTTYAASCGVIPFDLPYDELFTGGEIEGSKCWELASSDVDSLVMFLEPASSFGGGERVWFSLDFVGWSNSYAGDRYGLAWQAVRKTAYHSGRQATLPDLAIYCFDSSLSGRYLSVTAFWKNRLADPNNRLPVRITWDDEAPVSESWEVGIDGDTVFLPYHKQFLEKMLEHDHLKLEVQGDSGWRSASFVLTGFEAAYSPVQAYCEAGLSLASSSVEDVMLDVAEAQQSAGFHPDR